MKKKLEEGQLVRCTVDKIAGTVVFVKIDDYKTGGAITFSEISPGRIRNIREYVFPGKKIVCRILRVRKEGIDLSLRRVKLKEKNEINEIYKKERSFFALLKTVVKEGSEKIIEKIKEDEESLADFLEKAKENAKSLEKYIEKKGAEKISFILKEKKEKESVIKRRFSLTNKNPEGISIIKNLIKKAKDDSKCENCEIAYIAAGRYMLKIRTKNPKQGDNELNLMLKNIEELAKKENCSFRLER